MQKVISFLYDEDPVRDGYRGLYEQVLALRKIPDWVDYELITKRILPDKTLSMCLQSDLDRVAYLQQYPDAWYFDADAIPDFDKFKDFKMEPGFVYMAKSGTIFDTWVILGNNCRDYFDKIMSYFASWNRKPPPMWPFHYMNTVLKDRIKPVPAEFCRHLQLNGTAKSAKLSGMKLAGNNYLVQYIDNNWILKVK